MRLGETKIDNILNEKRLDLFLKRLFDILASGIGLLVLLIPMVILSIIIATTSKGGVFFKQERVGKGGKPFQILKFRSMVADAPQKGRAITTTNDARITKVGAWIRKYKLDELPQLINVLVGDMSLIGPRPEVMRYVAMYDERQREVLKVKPGITDLASIEYRDESDRLEASKDPEKTYVEEIMPKKLDLNLEYIENFNFFYDIKLIFRTLARIVE